MIDEPPTSFNNAANRPFPIDKPPLRQQFCHAPVLLLLAVYLPMGVLGGTIQFEVPNGLLNVDGNDASRLPFGYPIAVHYQQVFDASQFGRVPNGGAFLTRIFPRADCSSTFKWLVTNLQVNLSTTLKSPDNLSAVFAENVGDDEMIVFGPKNYIPPGSASTMGSCPDPQPFGTGNEINLDIPFFYNPARGNLLMDLRHLGNSWKFGDPRQPDEHKLDAQNMLGDSVSRAAAFSVTTTMAEVVDSSGLVLEFQFDPIPSLTNSITTNGVLITWPTLPTTFLLQWSERLGMDGAWRPYTNEIGGGGLYRMVTIPFERLKGSEFFRLAWESGHPIPQSLDPNGASSIPPSILNP
jgi:hypothetical protein